MSAWDELAADSRRRTENWRLQGEANRARETARRLDELGKRMADLVASAVDPLREAAERIAALTEDDIRDYEQGLCFFCGAGREPIPGPRGGTHGTRPARPTHKSDCSYIALRVALESR